ncbi:hypothetical protein [Mycolicibacterium phocaicum]|uniref:Uncharacterized protein n=1 Tax=Mycolicibacterium phocaicum TaxID=319706 RepID=A0A7I7ZPX5_9MYCO|nr:hypothetical protein [Mycolicibacterium phocaicum]TLH72370.1 hypothetical protein C1S79_06060 [Mycolicibacterium phocaicum]BBZ55214.1 hypothetical protein MPHO_22060 [Mycolicibacterium phocaicum]
MKAMITEQQDEHSWQFVFLGASIDSVKVAGSLGISADAAMDFVAEAAPMAMERLGAYTASMRSVGHARFSDEDRAVSRGESN